MWWKSATIYQKGWVIVFLLILIESFREWLTNEEYLITRLVTKIQYELEIYSERKIIKRICKTKKHSLKNYLGTTYCRKDDEKFYLLFYNEIYDLRLKTQKRFLKYFYRKEFKKSLAFLNDEVGYKIESIQKNKKDNPSKTSYYSQTH